MPLDHAGQTAGTVALAVGIAHPTDAHRGVLLFLTGGPGQPGIPFLTRIQSRLRTALTGYRLVMIDQRGTGAGALDCPALQQAAGASDLTVVSVTTVAACARSIGAARRFYSTAETVADIEALRVALNAPRLTLDGVSYGSFVAERYALVYPTHVARIVLDSVVPQAGVDPLYRAALSGSARVLRSACAAQRCGWDPAADVAAIISRLHDGPALLDALVADSVAAPDFPGVLDDLHAARAGRPARLEALLAAVRRDEAAPAGLLSQGLYESTGRARAPETKLPPVPVLLLCGLRDLSTPLAWARAEAAMAPDGLLLEVAGAGHSVQLRARDPRVRQRLARFLSGT